MTAQESFAQQFIKQGMAYGLTQIQATNFFKSAADKYANDWGGQLQGLMDSAQGFAQQNPAMAGAAAGGLGGAVAGGIGGGAKGALGGGLAGAGIGGAAGLSLDPHMQAQLMQMLRGGVGGDPFKQGVGGSASGGQPGQMLS